MLESVMQVETGGDRVIQILNNSSLGRSFHNTLISQSLEATV